MNKHSSVLGEAATIMQQYPHMNRDGKRSAIKSLAASGFFGAQDIHRMTGASIAQVTKVNGGAVPSRTPFEPKTLDALTILAVGYEDDEQVSPVLVRRIVEWGTPLRSIARLTGVPLDILREAVQ